ncbi:DUF222 domain-containing protein [Pseudonocardia xinjiangensis]|uniref:HNH endonuclease signature motif containing protein n=1 Tax=Pseudonocardia xinjiangensis TaxID=75289 RepID=UPI003D93D3E1
MSDSPLTTAHRLLVEAIDALSAATDSATDDDLLSVLTLCEGTSRRLDRVVVATVATLERRGTFAERGYTSTSAALGDLLGWERFEARTRVVAAEQVYPRVSLDGTALPAKLPATAAVFAAGATGLRHVAVIARVLASPAAERLTPDVWAGAEAQLADKAAVYTPSELQTWGTALVEALDEDGAEPDDRRPAPVNELHLLRHRGKPGGTLKGRFDDAAMFDAIATVIDAHARPASGDEHRSLAQRQADALADVCGYVLDHGDVPECGGRRPHLNVLIRLEDLENRARAACLDFGGTLTPESLRMLACDAAVVPVVLNGKGQPLDVGRATRTIPDGLRRAIAARDRGCAGCGRPPSWCEVHHITAWQDGGDTALHNCVMLCRACHRLQHHSEWEVRIRDGLPELIPPAWIDPQRRPRRQPLLHLAA